MTTGMMMAQYAVLFLLGLALICLMESVLQIGSDFVAKIFNCAKKALLVAANNASDK